MKFQKIKGPLFLLLAAMVWGASFVAQDLASSSVGPLTFNGARMTLGGLALLPVILVKNRGKLWASAPTRKDKKTLLLGGVVCGTVVFFAAWLQQLGIAGGTSAGKSGFITAMYVILVPLVGLFIGKKTRPALWLCVVMAAIGLYLLCMASFADGLGGILSHLKMSSSDLITLGCAVLFTFHILAIDHFAPGTDGVFLSSVQFIFAGILGLVFMFFLETPTWSGILAAGGAILYAALFSCGIGYTFQILGQSSTPPALASLIMCLESVFAVLSDAIFLKTPMSAEEVCGCVLMFGAIATSSLLGSGEKNEKAK